ncbi:MAG: hypothetical protein ABIR67_08245, partial [Gaiellaceae bacterium]
MEPDGAAFGQRSRPAVSDLGGPRRRDLLGVHSTHVGWDAVELERDVHVERGRAVTEDDDVVRLDQRDVAAEVHEPRR